MHCTRRLGAANGTSGSASDPEWPIGHKAVRMAVRLDNGCMLKCDRIVADALDTLLVSGMTVKLCPWPSGRN